MRGSNRNKEEFGQIDHKTMIKKKYYMFLTMFSMIFWPHVEMECQKIEVPLIVEVFSQQFDKLKPLRVIYSD